MNFKDLRHLDKDEILGLLGLETKTSTGAAVAGTLGTFGIGLLVGAGIALLLAPKPGRQLREDLREKLRRSSDLDERVGSISEHESLGGASKAY
jgi:gas vesicle protein